MQRFSVVAIRDGGTGGAGGEGGGRTPPQILVDLLNLGGRLSPSLYFALLDITSGPEVQQNFKIRTVWKPGVFLTGCRTFKNWKKNPKRLLQFFFFQNFFSDVFHNYFCCCCCLFIWRRALRYANCPPDFQIFRHSWSVRSAAKTAQSPSATRLESRVAIL